MQPGDQTLISMHNQWYIVERFEDADNGYQIEEFVKKSEFEKFSKEIKEHGRSGRIKSIQGGFDWYDRVDQQRDSLERRKSSADNDKIGYRGENKEMVRMAQSEADRGERSSRDGNGDRESGSTDRQGDSVKSQFSLDYKPTPKDPVTAYIVEGWGEDTDTDSDQEPTAAKKTTEAERKAAIAEEKEQKRRMNSEQPKQKKSYNIDLIDL